jgi:hypothetical protein
MKLKHASESRGIASPDSENPPAAPLELALFAPFLLVFATLGISKLYQNQPNAVTPFVTNNFRPPTSHQRILDRRLSPTVFPSLRHSSAGRSLSSRMARAGDHCVLVPSVSLFASAHLKPRSWIEICQTPSRPYKSEPSVPKTAPSSTAPYALAAPSRFENRSSKNCETNPIFPPAVVGPLSAKLDKNLQNAVTPSRTGAQARFLAPSPKTAQLQLLARFVPPEMALLGSCDSPRISISFESKWGRKSGNL